MVELAANRDVLDEACAQTGLTDFGDDSFREGLQILLSALQNEARLNAGGQLFLHQRIVGYLAQRLQVEDWYHCHPEIDDVPITAPLIGLGLPRTGSTALSMLLAQDPDVRYLRRWESSQPCPPPRRCEASTPVFPKARARWSAPVTTCPPRLMVPWNVMS